MNLGLLSGLAAGLEKGLGSYQNARRLSLDEEMQKKRIEQEDAQTQLRREDLLADRNSKKEQYESSLEERKLARESNELLRREAMKDKSSYQRDLLDFKRDAMSDKKEARQLAAPKVTADQGKAATFAARMDQAEQEFGALESEGFDRSSVKSGLLSALPGIANFAKPEGVQRQEQAERNFVNAVLRRESGAAISPSEFDSASKQYFPRAGDTAEVIEQKKRNRELARQGLEAESGPGLERLNAHRGQQGGLVRPQAQQAPQLSGEDAQALQWAQSNSRDPRAQEIMKRLGGR